MKPPNFKRLNTPCMVGMCFRFLQIKKNNFWLGCRKNIYLLKKNTNSSSLSSHQISKSYDFSAFLALFSEKHYFQVFKLFRTYCTPYKMSFEEYFDIVINYLHRFSLISSFSSKCFPLCPHNLCLLCTFVPITLLTLTYICPHNIHKLCKNDIIHKLWGHQINYFSRNETEKLFLQKSFLIQHELFR